MNLCALFWMEDPGINLIALLSIYVGYQLIYRNRSVVTVGLIVFLLYDMQIGAFQTDPFPR